MEIKFLVCFSQMSLVIIIFQQLTIINFQSLLTDLIKIENFDQDFQFIAYQSQEKYFDHYFHLDFVTNDYSFHFLLFASQLLHFLILNPCFHYHYLTLNNNHCHQQFLRFFLLLHLDQYQVQLLPLKFINHLMFFI